MVATATLGNQVWHRAEGEDDETFTNRVCGDCSKASRPWGRVVFLDRPDPVPNKPRAGLDGGREPHLSSPPLPDLLALSRAHRDEIAALLRGGAIYYARHPHGLVRRHGS